MSIQTIPTSVEELNQAWFDAVLDQKVTAVKVIEVMHGTATKINLELTFAEADGGSRTQSVWVKTGLEPHSKSIGNDKVYAGETYFYRNLGGQYETRTPDCLYADTDDDGNSIIVLDDLTKIGAKFAEPENAASPEFIKGGLEAIARYQAASWMNPELAKDEWLSSGGSYNAADVLAWLWNPEHWEDYSKRPRFQKLDPSLRDRDTLFAAHTALQKKLWPSEPWALCHGDAHFGQAYSLPSGEVRLLDWQCVQIAHWAHDVSYFMIGGLTVEDRRKHEKDLLNHYVTKLKEFGVADAPSLEEAYQAYRAYAFHGIGWVMCMVEMQPEHVCAAMTERYSAALVDLGTIDILLG